MYITMNEIEAAFSPKVFRGPLSKKTAKSLGPEYKATEEYLRGKTWKELLGDEFSHDFAETLYFISPEAFSVYAPAYFYWIVEKFSEGDYLPNALVSLMASRPQWLLSELNYSQLVVVRRVLDWLDAVHGDEFHGTDRRDLEIAMSEVDKRIGEQHGEARKP